MDNQHYKFELTPLPYSYSALEPHIDTQTMQIHHDRHLASYVNNLNAALANHPKYHSWTLEQLLQNINYLPAEIRTPIRNNGGGVYNHDFFFAGMAPGKSSQFTGALADKIIQTYGDAEKFKQSFKAAALSVFGSGYAWLTSDQSGTLRISVTANQDTVLPLNLRPLLLIDVWEHAYYLKHQNLRAEYIDAWLNVVDFERGSELYARGRPV